MGEKCRIQILVQPQAELKPAAFEKPLQILVADATRH
jgi:hypothetical protein